MVHALSEAWRILVPDGKLLDLRPCSATYPIDVETPAGRFHVGDFDGTGAESDDAAADTAIRSVVEAGLFTRLRDKHFNIEFCWDTVSAMESHARQEGRITSVSPSYAELEKACRDFSTGTSAIVRLRYRRSTMLAVYRKAEPRPARKARTRNPGKLESQEAGGQD